jgi:hypothetical protein
LPAAGAGRPPRPQGRTATDWDEVAERFTDPWTAGVLLDELELGGRVAMCLYYGDGFGDWPA